MTEDADYPGWAVHEKPASDAHVSLTLPSSVHIAHRVRSCKKEMGREGRTVGGVRQKNKGRKKVEEKTGNVFAESAVVTDGPPHLVCLVCYCYRDTVPVIPVVFFFSFYGLHTMTAFIVSFFLLRF